MISRTQSVKTVNSLRSLRSMATVESTVADWTSSATAQCHSSRPKGRPPHEGRQGRQNFSKKKTEKHKNKFLLHFFGECPHLPVHTVHGSLSRPKLYRSNMLKLLTAWGKVYRCSICAVLVQSEMCPKCFQMLVHSLSTRRWWTHRQSPPQLAET